MGREGAAFMKGFTKRLGANINAAEASRLQTQRDNALALKEENLIRLRGSIAEDTAAKDRASREGIAGDKAVVAAEKEKTRSRREGSEFAVSLGLDPEADQGKFERAVELYVTGKMPEGEEPTGEEKGWLDKIADFGSSVKDTVTGMFRGDGEPAAPTVGGSPTTNQAAPMAAPTVSGATGPEPPSPTAAPKTPLDVPPAPPKALGILKKDPSPENIEFFKRKFGYIPEEYKQ